MKSVRSLDFGAGLFVLLGFAALAYLVTQTTNLKNYGDGKVFSVTARFSNVGDLVERAPIKIAGVNVGEVKSVELDQDTFEAVVEMVMFAEFDQIPDDSTAKISTAGLLGRKFIAIDPGGSPDYLVEGSEFFLTQSAIVIEDLIGKFVFDAKPEEAAE